MKRKQYTLGRTTLLSFALLAGLALAMGAGLAQSPQGAWLSLEVTVSPGEVSLGDGFLTTLTLRNEGTEPATVDQAAVELPRGVLYVGQGAGSEVADSPQAEQSQLRWMGPFTVAAGAEFQIRFAAFASDQAAPGEYAVQAVALSGEQSLAAESSLVLLPQASLEPPASQPVQAGGAAAAPGAIQVSKTAEPTLVKPGNPVAYTVTFANTGAQPVPVNTITDLLPAPFQYVRLAYGSDITMEPSDQNEPEIVWDEWTEGPPQVPAGGTLVLRYWVWVPPDTPFSEMAYGNTVNAYSGTSLIGSDSADVGIEAPSFTVEKAASPTELMVGGTVIYTLTFENKGTGVGTLDTITDTLPAGFEFLDMVSGNEPANESGPIIWKDLTVPVNESRQLVYRVHAGSFGLKENRVEAVTAGGVTVGPESVPVQVNAFRTYLPMVSREEQQATTLPFEDTFDQGVASDWVVFLNYPGLSADSWDWTGVAPTWGRYLYDFEESTGGDNYALSMYLGPGSQAWTDYEVTTTIKNTREKIAGLWIRGTYEERNDLQGGQVGGYYVWMKPGASRVLLARITAGSQQYHVYDDVLADVEYAAGIGTVAWFNLKVQVNGNNIKVWLKKSTDSDYGAALIDVDDGTYAQGTVGFSAWRTYVLYDDIKVTPLQ